MLDLFEHSFFVKMKIVTENEINRKFYFNNAAFFGFDKLSKQNSRDYF